MDADRGVGDTMTGRIGEAGAGSGDAATFTRVFADVTAIVSTGPVQQART